MNDRSSEEAISPRHGINNATDNAMFLAHRFSKVRAFAFGIGSCNCGNVFLSCC